MQFCTSMQATSVAHPASGRLPWPTIGLYGLPAATVSFVYMLVTVMYMNFATDVLRIGPATVGAIFLASKVWDAVSDPAVGYLSDRTGSAMGRRRSWMLFSSVPVAGFAIMMWAPPAGLEGAQTTLWIAVAIFGFYTAYTAFYVPHLAMGAELSFQVAERNRIYGARQVGHGLGLLGAFSLGAPLLARADSARATALELGWAAGVACLVSIAAAALWLPREPAQSASRGARNLRTALRDVWRNPHAKLLLFVFFIESFGVGATSAMAPYVVKYVIQEPDVLGVVLLAFFVPSAVSIPVWVWLAGRFERHKLWRFAMMMSCVGYGSLAFLDVGRVDIMLFCGVLCGTSAGCGNTLGQAIKADVIDYDEYATGERKEGSYFATWAFVGKLAAGLVIGLAGLALDWAGYVENAEQSALTRRVMVMLIGGVPCVSFVIGILAFSRFRLDSAEHARIRHAIDARRTD